MLRSRCVAALLAGATAAWADTIEDKAALCGACHGEKGIPEDPTTPIIWGQNAGYLYLQFRDFQKGARKDDRMTPIAQGRRQRGRAGARRIFRRQTLAQHRRAERLKGGRRTPRWSPSTRSSARAAIWSSFRAIRPFPASPGRNAIISLKTMTDFRDRTRANNPGMSDLMNTVTPDQLAAIANYLAGL